MRPTVGVCGPFDRLLDAGRRLLDTRQRALPVVANDGSQRPIGWVTTRDVVRAAARDPGSVQTLQVRSAMTACTLVCGEDLGVVAALERMREARLERLPVVDANGGLCGIVSIADLAGATARGEVGPLGALRIAVCEALAARAQRDDRPAGVAADVRDAMTSDVIACRVDDDLERVAALFFEADVPCLPVIEAGEGRRLAGIVTARDLCRAAVSGGVALDRMRASDAMREKVASCWPNDSLESAEAIMRAYRVRRLPVVDSSGSLVGIVSLCDIARAALRDPVGSRGEALDVVETLAAASGTIWGAKSHNASE